MTRAQLRIPLIDNADGVYLHILLFDKLSDVLERVTAAIVLAIGDQKKRFFRIAARLQFFEPYVYSIVHRRHALRGVKISLFWSLETSVVKSEATSGRFANSTRKNSSSGLPVFKNVTAASRAVAILSFMLPLTSKITPMLMATSSEEKYAIFCSSLSSQI